MIPKLCLQIFLIISLLPASASFAQGPEGGASPSGELGQRVFRKHCASCHGSGGAGDGPAAAALKNKPADLRRIKQRNSGVFPKKRIAEVIDGREMTAAHGSREMPVWGERLRMNVGDVSLKEELMEGNLRELIEYLVKLQE